MWDANYTPQGMMRALGPFGAKFACGYVNSRFAKVIPDQEERRVLGRYLYQISVNRGSGEYALAALLAPGAWARDPLHSHLRNIQMPTVFLYGKNDWMDSRHAEAAAAQMNVPCRIESLEEADHHLYIDNADEFNRIVSEEIILTAQEMNESVSIGEHMSQA
jgi:cardiolipin-specific phospholipase